jgi:autotransporter-associated beta strand protein
VGFDQPELERRVRPGPAYYTDGSNVLFDDNNNNNYSVILNTQVNPVSVAFNSAGNYTLCGSGGIAGTGWLTKSGIGTLFLNTANTYSGGTTVTLGTLIAGMNGALPGNQPLALTEGNLQLALNTGGWCPNLKFPYIIFVLTVATHLPKYGCGAEQKHQCKPTGEKNERESYEKHPYPSPVGHTSKEIVAEAHHSGRDSHNAPCQHHEVPNKNPTKMGVTRREMRRENHPGAVEQQQSRNCRASDPLSRGKREFSLLFVLV